MFKTERKLTFVLIKTSLKIIILTSLQVRQVDETEIIKYYGDMLLKRLFYCSEINKRKGEFQYIYECKRID